MTPTAVEVLLDRGLWLMVIAAGVVMVIAALVSLFCAWRRNRQLRREQQ